MGQKLGKAQFYVEVDPFTNCKCRCFVYFILGPLLTCMLCIVPRRSIALLWQVFNDIADGFGITKDEMQDIFCDLAIELNISQMAAKEKACALFLILDTDKNGLVDALEMFSALAAISGMRLHEIFDFALSCYDFDGIQELSVDEVTLALKSLSVGLSKLSNLNPPSEEVVEQLVTAVSCLLFSVAVTLRHICSTTTYLLASFFLDVR